MNDWKPTDVGLTAQGRLALRRKHDPDGWIDSQGAPWSNKRFPENVRPLVVIDPEDRGAVGRLIRLFDAAVEPEPRKVELVERDIDDMQAALREFAAPKPPRPDEPQGLGAVVEDAEGYQWVRTGTPEGPRWYRDNAWAGEGNYAQIDVVRVLSEGIRP